MKTLITYKSHYGSSKQYAQWLGEDLSKENLQVEVKNLNDISKKDLADYDLIIHGGGLYAGGLSGLGFYKKNIAFLQENNKKLVVFATGAAPYGKRVLYEVKTRNFQGEMKDIPFFFCEGNYNYPIMKPVHKIMMKMMNKMLTKQIKKAKAAGKEPAPMDVEFQAMIFSHFEKVDRKWCQQIVEYVNSLL